MSEFPQTSIQGQQPEGEVDLFSQGLALHRQGLLWQAQELYLQVLARQPRHWEAMNLLGVIAAQSGNLLQAIEWMTKTIEIHPDIATTHANLGNALLALGRHDEAVASYDRAVWLNPGAADAYFNRGNALLALKRFDEAVLSYDHAIALNTEDAQAFSYRGRALAELKRLNDSVLSYDQAIALNPNDAQAYTNRGNVFQALKRFDDALLDHDRAIALDPRSAQAHSNRGNTLQSLRRFEEAWLSYDCAMELNPDYADAYLNKSMGLLLSGQIEQGWHYYEWRWKSDTTGLKNRNFKQPMWSGVENIAGKTLLLHAEQGLGDTIQFCRYAKMVKSLKAQVFLEIPKALIGLFSTLEGVDGLIEAGSPLPPFDYHCPLLSLPLAFKTELRTIPSASAYLAVDPKKREEWARRLGEKRKMRVGLVWSGNSGHKNDSNRSLTLKELMAGLPNGIEYVSLQKEIRSIDALTLADSHIQHFGEQLTDFSDTAALCDLMDLVISVDTSVAHLSGALGKKTWILLPESSDWRWLLDRLESPWYPSVRLYRQGPDDGWWPVLKRIADDLARCTVSH